MKRKNQALAYLKEKKLEDLKDELLVMKLSYFLSMPKVRYGILAAVDILILFLANYGTNVIKGIFSDVKYLVRGESSFSCFDIMNFIDFRHSLVWYVFVAGIILFIDIKVSFMIYTNYRDINKNQKGSTRWSTLDEIREQYPAIPLKMEQPYETYYGKGGVPVCQYGTHYEKHVQDEEPKLCNINKGIIFIDRTPVNNLIIGITRSGKGEMFVFLIIDIYSRAENKEYWIRSEQEEDGTWFFRYFAANIYYDYREGGERKEDIPELIDERKLAFGKKEYFEAIRGYERDHDIRLDLPEEIQEEDTGLYDYIDSSSKKNMVTEVRAVSYLNKVKPKRNRDDRIELKLLSKRICIIDAEAGSQTEYAFQPEDGQSKKDALDRAFLQLGLLRHPFEQKYEEYREAMGFELKEIRYRVNQVENINYTDVANLIKGVTSDKNQLLSQSDAYKDVPIEEVLEGELIQNRKEKSEKADYLKLLRKTMDINHIPESQETVFHFTRNYQASMVVSDPKLELFTASKHILELRGYRVYCINLINPYESSCYNPLQLITDTYKNGDPAEASAIARSLATSIFDSDAASNGENAFFYKNAAFLTAALIMSEVIDELRADEEANKEYLQEHIEATNRFQKLSKEEKKEICRMGKELQKLKNERYQETDKFQMVMLDRKIKELEKKVLPYNYKQEEFQPHNDNEKKINLPNVLLKFTMLAEKVIPPQVEGAEPRNALDVFFEKRDSLDVARNLYSAIKIAGGERVKGSVYSTVLSELTGFMDDKIKKMTAYSSFQLESIGFGERPVAVFMALPDFDNSNLFIQSIFISQVYYALAKKATVCGGKCQREVIFLLDEFGNIPCISNMASMITVCLGRNIRFNLVVQAYSQLEKEYGENDSDTIYGNCGNQIYILTDNYDTAEQFSNLVGKETIVTVTRMGGELSLTTQKQYTESTEEKPLKNANELMEFVEGECIVKRVMMRKDQYNNKVKPRPIYNHDKTVFPLRYQYLSDWYNTENRWETLHADSCAQLDLSLYLSDFDKMIQDIAVSLTEEYMEWYRITVDNYEKNKKYPIGDFVNKQDIVRKLMLQVGELRAMPKEKLYQLTISDIETYYIRYESNLPAFRQRMYEVSDWSRVEEKTLRSYSYEIIRFLQLALGENAADVWEMYEFDEEEKLLNTTTEEIFEIMEEQEVPERNILQFKNALEKYERRVNVS